MRHVRRAAFSWGSEQLFIAACCVCYLGCQARAEYNCPSQRKAAAKSPQRNVTRAFARLVLSSTGWAPFSNVCTVTSATVWFASVNSCRDPVLVPKAFSVAMGLRVSSEKCPPLTESPKTINLLGWLSIVNRSDSSKSVSWISVSIKLSLSKVLVVEIR